MPLVQFHSQSGTVSRRMATPKKIQDLQAWYKLARATIPTIPVLCPAPMMDINICKGGQHHWHYEHEPEATVNYVKFTLINGLGHRAHVVIDRTKGVM